MVKGKFLGGPRSSAFFGAPLRARPKHGQGKTASGSAPSGREKMVSRTAFETGRDAWHAGQNRAECPFDVNSSAGESWIAGWEDAECNGR